MLSSANPCIRRIGTRLPTTDLSGEAFAKLTPRVTLADYTGAVLAGLCSASSLVGVMRLAVGWQLFRYGSTLYSAIMPDRMCSSKWQWYIQVPGSSGTMSTVSICAEAMKITSVRLPPSSTTLPCQ